MTLGEQQANQKGFYAAMGMCGIPEEKIPRYYNIYQIALNNPTVDVKALVSMTDEELEELR